MRCRTCGVNLPPGAKACPNCGTAVPGPEDTVVDTSSPEPPIPPTLYGGPVPPAPGYTPDIQNPYDRPVQPSSPSYNNQANQYQSSPNLYQPGSFNQNQAVPNQYANQYPGVPPAYPPGYLPPQQQQPPRRKTRWGLIIGIIAIVLILACIGSSFLVVGGLYNIGKSVNAQATATAAASTSNTSAATNTTPATNTNTTPAASTNPADTNTTPAASSNSTGANPSGLTIDTDAASIITDAQSARNVNQDTAAPVDPTSTFNAGDRVYVVFKLNNNKVNVTTQTVYVGAKFYVDSVLAAKINPITFDKPVPGGYFAGTYKVASKGTAELYLCYKSDCSDGKLAQVVNFTVA